MGDSSQFGNSKSILSKLIFLINIYYSISNISVSNPLYTKKDNEITFQRLTEGSGAEREKKISKTLFERRLFYF